MGCEKICKIIERMILKTEELDLDPQLWDLIYSLEVWNATGWHTVQSEAQA